MGITQSCTFINLLEQLESNSTFRKNKHFGTAFEDIINYIMINGCSPTINKLIGSDSIYKQLPSNTKGIDGILITHGINIGVQIKFSKNIDKPLCCSKKQFDPCLEVCKSHKFKNILIITNRERISPTVGNFFEKEGIKYYQLTRDDFKQISSYHVNNIKNLKSVNDLITNYNSSCLIL